MRLERLPRSIMGFRDRAEPVRSVDLRAFKGACHLVAQMEIGAVEAFCSDLLVRNHYSARLSTRAERVVVLCNATYPYVAFSPAREGGPTWRDRTFVSPVLQAAFEALTDFRPLDAGWLMSDLTPGMLGGLSRADLEQVRHWEPDRVGAVVFNEWG